MEGLLRFDFFTANLFIFLSLHLHSLFEWAHLLPVGLKTAMPPPLGGGEQRGHYQGRPGDAHESRTVAVGDRHQLDRRVLLLQRSV